MLDSDQILSLVSAELSRAKFSLTNDGNDLEEALSLYLGLPDGKEVEGRSQVISTDIADAIEWIMPQIMKSFTQNNEIVVFDPVKDGDEKQSELESEYVYDVLMKQNDGFVILHQFVKDALMQRNGILKIYYAEHTKRKVTDWTGITKEQVEMLLAADGVELIESSNFVDQELTILKQQELQKQLTLIQQQLVQNPQLQQEAQIKLEQIQVEMEQPVMLYDVQVSVERVKGQIYVDPVPPEEFRVNAQHNSLILDNARFTAHVVMKPISEVIEEYEISFEEAKELPKGTTNLYMREYRHTVQEGSVFYDHESSDDEALQEIEVAECYMKMDIDGNGITKLLKVTTAGGDTPTDLLMVEEVEEMPWVSTTAFLMSHKWEGISIADRLKQIQDQKTTLWRNMFDNMYLQNNQRHVVLEGQVNLDDLLVSRPGGIVRVKRPDAVSPLATPQLGADAYNMMEYLDRVRAGRTGVDPDGSATPQNIGDRVGSEGVDRLMNAKEELVGLIIRVIAETGVKPLCYKIRDLSIKHINKELDYKFRGVWHKINPSTWGERMSCTVRVGTGTGNHLAQLNVVREILAIQKEILADDRQALVQEQQLFNAMDDFCKFSGLNGAVRYMLDPSSDQGKEERQKKDNSNQQQQQLMMQKEKMQLDLQNKLADAEMSKAVAQQQAVQAKREAEAIKGQLQTQKQEADAQIKYLETQLTQAGIASENVMKDEDRRLKERDMTLNAAVELTRIEAQNKSDEDDNFTTNRELVQ